MTWEEKEKKYGKPLAGKVYMCEMQHFSTKKVVRQALRAVEEDDCLWRTLDDNSEIDEWNWDVISWEEIT